MLYIVLALISALCLGGYEVFKKVSLNKSSVYEVLFLYCLCSFVFSFTLIDKSVLLPISSIGLIFLKSIIIVINWIFVMKAVDKLDVSVSTPIGLFNTVLVVIFSYFIYDDKITWIHIVSMLLIGTGVILVSLLNRKDFKKENHFKYIIFLLIGTFLGACSAMLDKYLLSNRNVEYNALLFYFFMFNSLLYGMIYFVKNKKLEFNKLKSNYFIILTAVAIFVAEITYYLSIDMGGSSLSIISIVRKFSVVVATVLASIFLKEKHLILKLGILSLMLIGVMLPILF